MFVKLIGTYHACISLRDKISKLFPQLEDYIYLFYANHELIAYHNTSRIDYTTEQKFEIQRIRSTSLSHQWLRPNDFIFLNNVRSFQQLNLLDEHQNRLLLLHFVNPIDQLKDTIALCFPKHAVIFGVQKEFSELSTDEKHVIGEMLHKLLSFDYHSFELEKEKLESIKRFYSQDTLSINVQNMFDFLNRTCENWIKEFIGEQLPVSIEPQVIYEICNEKIDLEQMKMYILKMVELYLFINDRSESVYITLNHLLAISKPDKRVVTNTLNENAKTKRVFEMLDRYEEVAALIQSKGEIINGKNVGRFLNPPISPPAISDSIKKNLQKIEFYLQENPTRWNLIRHSLKPLRDLDLSLPFKRIKG